ncbi:MAG TPA: hypothetical protein VK014_12240 [Cyclobacteriaceae bacterium]|nr:hypothetical protein [Cyclobacteriaceae bacterium]
MAEIEDQNNHPSPSRKANPSDSGRNKAQIKEGKTADELEREDEIRQEHTDKEQIPSHLEKHANRNPNKPDIDKPSYGGT